MRSAVFIERKALKDEDPLQNASAYLLSPPSVELLPGLQPLWPGQDVQPDERLPLYQRDCQRRRSWRYSGHIYIAGLTLVNTLHE